MKNEKLDVLAFGAHPDDVEIGCGGTLYKLAQMGYASGIIDITEGEMGSRGTVEERYEESAEAARILQAKVRLNLKIPDAGISQSQENRLKVIEAIRRYRPALIFAPYPADRHPDHIYASQLISEAAFYAGLKKIGPEQPPAHRPKRVIYYPMTYEFEPSFVVDISEHFPAKMEAIRAYRSQFYNPEYEAAGTFIASKDFLEAMETRARHFGWKAGVKYAEPFWVRETLALDDLFSALTKNKM